MRKNVLNMSATWKSITAKDHVKTEADVGADSTVMSSFVWTELGKPQLDGKISSLEA